MIRHLLALGVLAALPLAGLAAEAEPASKKEEKKATGVKARVAVFRLAGPVTELPVDDPFAFGSATGISLKDLVARLKKAASDPAIRAVVLLPAGYSIGVGQIEEVRQALKKVRAAGKEVYAHADSLGMRDYVLLSGASRLSVVPTADLWLLGIGGEAPYLRGLLDKIGVKPDFLTCGAYKSAAESFMRTGPSPEAEKMQNWLLDGIYDTMVRLIAEGRGLKPEKVRELIDGGPYRAKGAQEAGLIDAIEPLQQFEAMLKSKYGKDVVFDKKYGQKKHPTLDLSSPFAGFKILSELLSPTKKKGTGKDAVGIVYVDGPILLGGSEPSLFGGNAARSSEVRRALDEAARDDSIKAVVLRIDSPGGSAVASEIILDATRRVKARKPFIVSMGDIAGSGGYYVACAADTIFADESTITGSIGVVGGKLVTTDMWAKVGVTFKEYKRGKNAGLLTNAEVFSPEERKQMQAWMDEVYDVFKDHVVKIRGKRLKKPIDEIAGGRVYTGRQALELGLVDKIGTLRDAIDHVADKAKLKDYEVRVVPEPKNVFEKMLEEALGEQDEKPGLDTASRSRLPSRGRHDSLVELALPHLRHMDPERVRVLVRALEQLQLVQQEGVILMVPELGIGR
jgi:protease-4